MALSEYEDLDAVGMAELVRAGDVSPAELAQEAIARIDARDGVFNAVVRRRFDQALDEARGELPDGPLRGVPYLLKDLHVSVPGEPTGCGTGLLQQLPRTHWSTMARRLRDAGLVVLGRTNTPEFGIMGITEPRVLGPSRNPFNPAHTSGGSSGGSGAAVGARYVPAAHASDGGGSIRIPASHNGLVGLKPTRARTPAGPEQAWGWSGLSIEHAVTRTVRDSAALLDAVRGPEPGGPCGVPVPERPYAQEVGRDPGRLRIAVMPDAMLAGENDAEVTRAVEQAAAMARDLGHEVEIASPQIDARALRMAYFTFVAAGVTAEVQQAARMAGVSPRPADFEGATWMFHRIGQLLSAASMEESRRHVEAAAYGWGQFFEAHDVVLTATCARPPALVGELYPKPSDERQMALFRLPLTRGIVLSVLDRLASQAMGATPNTQLANLVGLPAISLPTAMSDAGLPIGTQWMAPFGREDVLIRLASQIEVAHPWADRRPASLQAIP